MNILVTGGAGFIGSHLVEHFQGRAQVRVLDNLVSGFQANLSGLSCEFIRGSILDRDCLRQAMQGVDYVFHLAAMVSVPESMQKPVECNAINTTGTLMVLEEASRAGAKKLVFSSSAAIYGNNPSLPKNETMLPEPESPYAITKFDGEAYCRLFTHEFGLPTVSLRYFNVFGPRQNLLNAYAAAIPIFSKQGIEGEPLTIHGDGMQTRDFISVKDIAAANEHFALHSPATGVFNIANGKSMTVLTLADEILRLANSRSKIIHHAARAGDIKHSCADISKSRAAGFNPASYFLEQLQTTVSFYQKTVAQKQV